MFGLNAFGQNTIIPDANFEQALIDLGIDSDGVINGLALTEDLSNVAELNVFSSEISDLTGIEDFTSLTNLNCSGNNLTSIDLSNNDQLVQLDCSSNLLTILDVSASTALVQLNARDNLLTTLDVSANTDLERLDFTKNQLVAIDIAANGALTSLKCSDNRLGNLDISNNQQLTELNCSSNFLNNLDVSSNAELVTLFCSSNQLTDLNVSNSSELLFLNCSDNQIATLDVNDNRLLEQLTCSANQLKSLDLAQNDSLRLLAFANNQVSIIDVAANLKLENMVCAANLLRFIEVPNNLLLRSVDFSSNLVETANFDGNDSLRTIIGSNNKLHSFSVQNGLNQNLNTLSLLNNPGLTCINIDDETQIGAAWLKDTSASYATDCSPILTEIPDSNFEQALIKLGLDTEPVDGTVITDSIRLITTLDVSGQNITDLLGIEDFASLENLNCSNNQITTLDFTKNAAFTDLNCSDNLLISLNMKNGNNGTLVTFDARNNATLTCIAVDDQLQIGTGWEKDGGATYEDNCNPASTFIPDDSFEQALIDQGIDVGPLDNYVATTAISSLLFLDISGLGIRDLTGIEGFADLDTLDCSSNQLFTIDVSQNIALSNLSCFSNFLSELDVSSNTNLISLNAGNNRLSAVDVSSNTDLESMIVGSNFLTEIDVNMNSALRILNVNSNNITEAGLDLSSNTNLEELLCANNSLSNLDVTQNGQLLKLEFSGNHLSTIDLSQNTFLTRLDGSSNFIGAIDLSNNADLDTLLLNSNLLQELDLTMNTSLVTLSAENNNLTTGDLTSNADLQTLSLSSNDLTTIDVSGNPLLNILHADKNQLSDIDLSNNLNLLDFSLADNALTALDVGMNTDLVVLNCDNNELTALDLSTNTDLINLSVVRNLIVELDLANNVLLEQLTINNNQLTELDLTNNPDLVAVNCSDNQIEELNFDSQAQLTSVNSSSNNLISLSIQNGNNGNLGIFNTINNPDLQCIQIDDVDVIGSSWQKDVTADYSENCRYNDTFVPDDNFEFALSVITGEPDNNDDYIATSAISSLASLDVSGMNISDLIGIQDFQALQSLLVNSNTIDSLYLKDLALLTELNVSGNTLTSIDVSENKNLEILDISNNQIGEILLDSLQALIEFIGDNNLLLELNVDSNSSLTQLSCASNLLTSLSIKNGNNGVLSILNATSNPDLTCIQVDDPSNIGSSWQKDGTASYSDNCHYNETFVPDDAFEQRLITLGYDYTSTSPLDNYVPTPRVKTATALNLSNLGIADMTGIEDFINLTSLNISNNAITELDVQENTKLEVLNCAVNQISAIDLTELDSLRQLNISNNELTILDVSQNAKLEVLNFSGNELTGIDITENVSLTSFRGQVNKLFSVDANNGFNENIATFDLRNNTDLTCILVDNVAEASSYPGWVKDSQAQYKLVCDDDDNDGVADAEDLCPITPFGTSVDLFGCALFTLPADNFTVLTTSESCRSSNNGVINITAVEILSYSATLISELDSVTTYRFGDKVEIRNVRAGRYSLCISVDSEPTYEQCYSLLITQPEDLKVLSSGRQENGRVTFEMSGSDVYAVEFNGQKFETRENEITLNLQHGVNRIRIGTDLPCQGVFEEQFYYSGEASIYPSPFNDYLSIYFGEDAPERVQVNIFSTQGRLEYTKQYESYNGGIKDIDTSNLPSGLYVIEIVKGNQTETFKVVKK